MSADEYGVILMRLDDLERRVRWRRAERALTLALLGWLLATGPAASSLRERLASFRPIPSRLLAREALSWSWEQVQSLFVVKPVLDPQVVLEDHREAFGESTPPLTESADLPTAVPPVAMAAPSKATSPSDLNRSPAANLLASSSAHARVKPLAITKPATVLGSRPVSSTHEAVVAPAVPGASISATGKGDLRASIREAERSMARASEDGAKLAAVLPSLAPSASGDFLNFGAGKAIRPAASLLAVLPELPPDLSPVASAVAIATPAASTAPETVPATAAVAIPPATLKALGYAQSDSGPSQAVLTDGTKLYVVNEGEEFADRFRVTAIRPQGLEVEDTLANQTLQLPFGH